MRRQYNKPARYLKMKWQEAAYWGFIGLNAFLFSYLILQIPWNYYQLAHRSGRDISCCLNAGAYTLGIACCVVAVSAIIILIRKNRYLF
jgi:hypothetical protein